MKLRRTLVLGFALSVLAIGASIAAAQAWWLSADDAQAPTRELVNKKLGQRVASFPGHGERIRGKLVDERLLFVATLADGSLCVNDSNVSQTEWGGGCNNADSPLGGKSFRVSFSFDGGPSFATVTDARLSGLVDKSVDKLTARMTDGSSRELELTSDTVAGTPYRAFAYRVSAVDLLAGVTPVAVVSYDSSGAELDRQATGLSQPK